jgi:small subunit ribosomal protein S21
VAARFAASIRFGYCVSMLERVCTGLSLKLGGRMVRLVVRDKESIQEAVRRFRKLVERSGIKKEMRRREYYEKPSEIKRRARLRAERRARRSKLPA